MKSQRRLNSQDDVDFDWVLVMIPGTDDSELNCAIVINKAEGIYQIENVPHMATHFALGDIVYAEFDESIGKLVYKYTIEHSGNKSLRVDLLDKTIDPWHFQCTLREFGFFGETIRENEYRFCINIEPGQEEPLKKLRLYLDVLVANGKVKYDFIKGVK